MALTPELILASASTARATLLRDAGVSFTTEPADIDETAIKRTYRTDGNEAYACAAALAEAKARAIASRRKDALVIGADQILVADDEWFDKPRDLREAATQLCQLRGRDHVLVTSACVVSSDSCLWRATVAPKLTMRCFGDAFLSEYLEAEGNAVLSSVGAYRLEGRGVQLFTRIEGDHFAILGLPLLELLEFLRGCGVVGE
jgi:septum formation protein